MPPNFSVELHEVLKTKGPQSLGVRRHGRQATHQPTFNTSKRLFVQESIQAAFVRAHQLADIEEHMGKPVQHVKNGVPLTEHGAKLLGVPWPPVS